MATEDIPLPAATGEARNELAFQWRRLGWAATVVALLSSPAAIAWLNREKDWPLGWAILGALGLVIAFRGLVDVGLRRLIPWPSLFGTEDASLREADVVARRRSWFWRFVLKLAFLVGIVAVIFLALSVFAGVNVFRLLTALLPLALILPVYLIFNVPDVDSVVAFMPPKKGPLLKTIGSVEAATIDSLTNAHLFKFQFQPLADGGVVLILDPPTA